MNQELQILLSLLNSIDTHGKQSLNNLLASIQIVEKLMQPIPEVEEFKG